jgi:hypothetical protein
MSGRLWRRGGDAPFAVLTAGLLTAIATIGFLGTGSSPAVALEDGLRLEGATTYSVDIGAGVVHASVEATATNESPDEVVNGGTRRYFFAEVFVPVLAEATNFAATAADGRALTVRRQGVDSDQVALAAVDLAPDLFYGQSRTFRLTYDLPHQPPRAPGFTRVNPAFATFAALPLGDPNLATVEIVVPDGFEVEYAGAELERGRREGAQVFTSGSVADPDQWSVVVVARNDAGLLERAFQVGDRDIVIRAWPDDAEWATFVEQTLQGGVPALEELVGLSWPLDGELTVVEAASPYIYGYAGWFLPEDDTIEVGDALEPHVILHELSHIWFNDSLFGERWMGEAFAEEFSARAEAALGMVLPAPEPADTADPGAFALATWGDPAVSSETADEREAYGYNASFFVLRSVADEVGIERLRDVIVAADEQTIAYRGDGAPEEVMAAFGSRRLLDLLQEVAGSDGAPALFERYVLTPDDVALLPARATARERYAQLVAAGTGWSAPLPVRDALSRWEFDAAVARADEATAILATRDEVYAAADDLELEVGAAFEEEYETADELEHIADTADAFLDATTEIGDAEAVVDGGHGFFETIGLLGSDANDALSDSRRAFQQGDADDAIDDAERAQGTVAAADTAGVQRVAIAAAVVVLGGIGLFVLRRRQR